MGLQVLGVTSAGLWTFLKVVVVLWSGMGSVGCSSISVSGEIAAVCFRFGGGGGRQFLSVSSRAS